MGKKKPKAVEDPEKSAKSIQKSKSKEKISSKKSPKDQSPVPTLESEKKAESDNETLQTDLPEEDHGLKNEEAAIFEYMLRQNRPYNALNIHDNLRGAIKKPQCQKALDKLVEIKKLQAKDFGKVRIYLVNQKLIPEVSQTELEELDNNAKELEEELEKARNEVKELQVQNKELDNALSTDELLKKIQENALKSENLLKEIAEFQAQGCVSEEMRKKIEEKLKSVQIEEKKRLRIFNSVVSGIAEIFDVPVKKAKELIGLE